jgi:hypothetical protein
VHHQVQQLGDFGLESQRLACGVGHGVNGGRQIDRPSAILSPPLARQSDTS